MCRIEQHAQKLVDDRKSVLASIAIEQLKNLKTIKKALETREFLPEINQPGLVVSTQIAEQTELNKQLKIQGQLKKQMLDTITPLIETIVSNYDNVAIGEIGTIQKATRYALQLNIVNNFLERIYTVGLPRDNDCMTISLKPTMERTEVNQDKSYHTGSFGLPGAQAVEIDMTNYIQDEDGYFDYRPSLSEYTNKNSPMIMNSIFSTKESFKSEQKSESTSFLSNLLLPNVSFSNQLAFIRVICHVVRKWIPWTSTEETLHEISNEESQILKELDLRTKNLAQQLAMQSCNRAFLSQQKLDYLDDAEYILKETKNILQNTFENRQISGKTIATIQENIERVHNWLEQLPKQGFFPKKISSCKSSNHWSGRLWNNGIGRNYTSALPEDLYENSNFLEIAQNDFFSISEAKRP